MAEAWGASSQEASSNLIARLVLQPRSAHEAEHLKLHGNVLVRPQHTLGRFTATNTIFFLLFFRLLFFFFDCSGSAIGSWCTASVGGTDSTGMEIGTGGGGEGGAGA